ncbi:transglycosylase SLT domain-containing protein [Kitasatospora sp. NPDC088346]|uniref:aggregation-promoting factor C-terminal-like domain-containing protein n=1 Tax=Kitasatospora sp. NPDC088346 TaxID=3364073 RepID=UPI0037F4D9A2
MRIFSTRLRASAALLASAAGVAALGSAVAPTLASAATPAYSPASVQAIAAQIVPANQLASFNQIVAHESSWNVTATNASSGAYGLVQALPASKMASAGADWKTNPATQIKWGLNYMNERYGSPNAAWAFWQTHHWY